MKRLEDIEKLSALDLERIAQDESIKVPAMLKHDIAITARTLEMTSKEDDEAQKVSSRRRFALFSYPAAAVAVIVIGLSITFSNRDDIQDTFDDPRMAYAQMEQVFGFISEKMNAGMDIAYAAEPAIEKTINALR